jgi:DNA-binding Xre family transcriptional regulator
MHNLRTYLAIGKLKIKDLADLIDVSPKNLSHIMTGRQAHVSLERKILIAATLSKRLKKTVSIYDIWPDTPRLYSESVRLLLFTRRQSKKAA